MGKQLFTVVTFYKFVNLSRLDSLRESLLRHCLKNEVAGTILLANEGINATIAGPETGIRAVLDLLTSFETLKDLTWKTSTTYEKPFHRMKVRLKKEIVKLGIEGTDPTQKVGTYVTPAAWNALISKEDVRLIDTRNDFEIEIGTFARAENPHTESFGDFPAFVASELAGDRKKPIAMFCTGGIRCEKATSFLLDQGFENVYHLKGGILKYLEEIPAEESLWEGECFVFDNRITVNHDLEKGSYAMCYACHHLLTADDQASPQYDDGVSCPYCHDSLSEQERERARERHRQMALAKKRSTVHLGQVIRRHSNQKAP